MATPASTLGVKQDSAVQILANFNEKNGTIIVSGKEKEIKSIESWNKNTGAVIAGLMKNGASDAQLITDTKTLAETTDKVVAYFARKQVSEAEKNIKKITDATPSSAPVIALPAKPETVVVPVKTEVAAPAPVSPLPAKPETVVAVVAAPAPVITPPEKSETVVAVVAKPEGTLSFFSKAWSVVTPGKFFGSLLASAALVKTAATTLCAPVAGWLGTQAQGGPVCAAISSAGNVLSTATMRQAAPYLGLGLALGMAVKVGGFLGTRASTVSEGERPVIVTSTDAPAEKPIAEVPPPTTSSATPVEILAAAEKPVETATVEALPKPTAEAAAKPVETPAPATKTTGSVHYPKPAALLSELKNRLARRSASADSRAPVKVSKKPESKRAV